MATISSTIACAMFIPVREYASWNDSTHPVTNGDVKRAKTVLPTDTTHQTTHAWQKGGAGVKKR